MIAFLQYDGRTLVLELSPLPGKPGYFDAAVVKLTGTDKPKVTTVLHGKKTSRKGQARQETKERAKVLVAWLKENPGKHPVNSTGKKVLGTDSPGSIISTVKECVRQKLVRYDRHAHPNTMEAL